MMTMVLILTLFISVFPGCANPKATQPPSSTSTAPEELPGGGEPSPPYTLELSFPNGAPALNQVAELKGVVRNKNAGMIDVKIVVVLPDGFEFESGNITWSADSLPFGDTEVINAQLRAIRTGNWTIEARITAAKSNLGIPEGGGQIPNLCFSARKFR